MPYTVSWLCEPAVVYLRLWGDVTREDIQRIDEMILDLFTRSDRPAVHVLADDRNAKSMPSQTELRQLGYLSHPKMGWFITQNPDRLMRFIAALVGHALKVRYRFVETVDDGIEVLTRIDLTLPDIETLKAQLAAARRSSASQGAPI